jgi:hypothetical protein
MEYRELGKLLLMSLHNMYIIRQLISEIISMRKLINSKTSNIKIGKPWSINLGWTQMGKIK